MGARWSAGLPVDTAAQTDLVVAEKVAPDIVATPAASRRRARLRAELRCSPEDIWDIHHGDIRAWAEIVRRIPGGHYRNGTDRLRRVATLDEAVNRFYGEALVHRCRLLSQLFR